MTPVTSLLVEHEAAVRSRTAARRSSGHVPRSAVAVGLLLIGLFVLRVYFGLSLQFETSDDVQIYLLGLKFFATGQWPFFGPDVLQGSDATTWPLQIAGPLQGLLVGLPFIFVAEPEAPVILLNVLSFGGLVLFGWYLARRFPLVPAWLTCAWLLTCPWTLNFSTHVYNPSYLLVLGCLFFVGFLELMPSLTGSLVPPGASWFLLGFSLAASFQFHLSWPLLVPFIALVVIARVRDRLLTTAQIGWLLAGAAVPVALLVPTVTEYGFGALFEALRNASEVNASNAGAIVLVTARFLSFASFELPRFLGPHWDARIDLLRQSPWLIPFVVALGTLGLAQPIVLLAVLFRPRLLRIPGDPCRSVRWLVVGTLVLVSVVFLFTSRPPLARNYYILSPVAFLAGYLAFGSLVQTTRARRWAVGILATGAILHIGLATCRLRAAPWATRRASAMRAIQEGNYRILGERRSHVHF
jgi:hypothetical protein